MVGHTEVVRHGAPNDWFVLILDVSDVSRVVGLDTRSSSLRSFGSHSVENPPGVYLTRLNFIKVRKPGKLREKPSFK